MFAKRNLKGINGWRLWNWRDRLVAHEETWGWGARWDLGKHIAGEQQQGEGKTSPTPATACRVSADSLMWWFSRQHAASAAPDVSIQRRHRCGGA
jgi:hypothetical protein